MNVLAAQTLTLYLHVTLYSDRASSNDWARVLAPFPLFRGISRRRLRRLVQHATFVEFPPGETVTQRDDRADSLYVILGGTATARRGPATRALHVGDYLGEAGFFVRGAGAARVVAHDELHVMRLPLRTYVRLAQHSPAISFAMLRNLGAHVRRLKPRAARC